MFSAAKFTALMGLAVATVSSVAGQNAVQTNVPKFSYGTPNANAPGVVATKKVGPTDASSPQMGTAINQTSEARLVSINSVDDWCTFSSPNGQSISDTEAITVAYCTKARNNARVIPDGTVTAAHFVKTPLYVQIMALGDFTKIGIPNGDYGGELDPHGATGLGNPVGGNVTSNVTGSDVFYEEWMNYISYQQMCFRVCIAGTDIAPTSLECQHTLDEMGCNWVMPGDYSDNGFDSCDGDSAYPPGLYPLGNGQTSTFQQYYSQDYTYSNGQVTTWIHGASNEVTPSFAYSLPATSNCQSTSTIANGLTQLVSSSSSAASSMSTSKGSKGSGSSSDSSSGSSSAAGAANSGSNASTSSSSSKSGAGSLVPTFALGSVISALVAGAFFLQ